MRFIELVVEVPGCDVERAGMALADVTRGGVWVEQPFTQDDLEADAAVDREAQHVLHAYVPADGDRGGAVLLARERLAEAGFTQEIAVRLVADEDWAEAWKEHFHVERYGERLVVVPSWRAHAAAPGDVVITLDPGMAFGTGQHETTRMCLEVLERTAGAGARVLDAGTGSGILAIAAMKLGAASVRAFDIDPVCVGIARANAQINGVEVDVVEGALGEGWPTEGAVYDIVVANIIARALIESAAALVGAVAPGGRLILSGIVREREAEVAAAFAREGATIAGAHRLGEWVCIEAVR